MAATPKRRRVRAALLNRAHSAIGPEASELDYVIAYVQDGGMVASLAEELATELGESVSRSFLSMVVHRLTDDATDRITAARREGAHALAEEAVTIVDGAPDTREGIQKAKLRADLRTWLASRWNASEFGEQAKTRINISVGQLHIDALRQRELARLNPVVAALAPAEAEAEVIPCLGDVEIVDTRPSGCSAAPVRQAGSN